MISKFIDWLSEPQTKIVKTTYGDGRVTYQGFFKTDRFTSIWILARDHSNFSKSVFESEMKLREVLEYKVNRIKQSRIVKVETI